MQVEKNQEQVSLRCPVCKCVLDISDPEESEPFQCPKCETMLFAMFNPDLLNGWELWEADAVDSVLVATKTLTDQDDDEDEIKVLAWLDDDGNIQVAPEFVDAISAKQAQRWWLEKAH